MSEFETKLRWLSESGNPVGAEDLIERIEAELAGDPLVVVNKRREGTVMAKTLQTPTTKPPNRNRGPAWGLAAFVAVLAVGGLFFAFRGGDGQVADTTPTPTTVAPDAETMTDLEVIEAGVAALYSGDAERAVELFELGREDLPFPDGPPDDDWIRNEAAFQAAIGGRLTLNCTEQATPGVFTCHAPYHNAITDAINYRDGGDTFRVVVNDGVIREFSFPEHSFLMAPLAAFITGVEGNQACEQEELLVLPRTAVCANLILEHLDKFAAEYQANS